MKELKNITIVTGGSRGDVQPYVALGIALKEHGYNVRIATNANFKGLVESFGIGFASIFSDSTKQLQEDPDVKKALMNGQAMTFATAISKINEAIAPDAVANFRQEMYDHKPDLIVRGTLVEFLCFWAAFDLDVPYIAARVQIIHYSSTRCSFGFPTLSFGMHYIFHWLFLNGYYNGQLVWEKAMGHKFVRDRITKSEFLAEFVEPAFPLVVLVSKLFQPILYPACDSPNLKFVGHAIVPSQKQATENFGGDAVKAKIQAFLQQDTETPTVYLGWGSMASKSSEYMTEFAVQTLKSAKVRGILLSGVAELSLDLLRDAELREFARQNVLVVSSAPHEWLFPKVALTVHHGGAGTTTAALRSGKPTIVTPVFLDQWDNAYLVNQLLCGYGYEKIQLQALTSEDLGGRIRSVLNDYTIVARCQEVSKLLHQENGCDRAVAEVEMFWKDHGSPPNFGERLLKAIKCRHKAPSSVIYVMGGLVATAALVAGLYYRKK